MRVALLCAVFAIFLLVHCSKTKNADCSNFNELPDPHIDSASWVGLNPKTLNASFVSIDKRFSKSTMPIIEQIEKEDTVEGWKGETVSAQLLLWSASEVSEVRIEISKFKSKASTMSSKIAQASFVRYVMTDEFTGGCGHRKPENFAASLSPDMLDNIKCINMEPMTARSVWITVNIPQDAVPGEYMADVEIKAKDHKTQRFALHLNVIDETLPQPKDWTMHMDMWQHPSAIARIHNDSIWSDEHFEHIKPYMKMAADMGQKVITATLNKDPWNNQCFDPYADMIIWTKNVDGSWSYDYTAFDKWVQLMMNLGIDKMINCYSMIPWNNEIHYTDGKDGKVVEVKVDPGTEEFEEMWVPFLQDFSKHLKEKGWLEITNIAMDERSPQEMEATLKVLQENAPELGIALADNHQSYKRYPFIKDMCVAAEAKVDHEDIQDRRERGLNTTYYVCCSHEFPNTFTFSDPAEGAYISWYALAADYDGFLRWAFNSWVANPLTDSRFRTWPAGDTYLIYPDARSSIRYERVREGVQDFEKVKILRSKLKEKNETEKLKQLDEAIAKLNTIRRTKDWNYNLNKAKNLVNDFSKES